MLGDFNYYGIETIVDYQKAFELYQEAANLGNAYGINNLGICYQSGIGTKVDYQEAFEFYQKAANLEYASAIPYFSKISHPLFTRILNEKFGEVLNFDTFLKMLLNSLKINLKIV